MADEVTKVYALNLFDIADREEYLAYSRRSAREVARHGGRVLALGRFRESAAGDIAPRQVLILVEWESRAAFESYRQDPALADLHPHREAGTSAYVWHLFDRLDDLRPLLRPLPDRMNTRSCRQLRIRQLHGDREPRQRQSMTIFTQLTPAPSDPPEPFTDRLRLAVAAYLARFKGTSREHTESDLRCYLSWCAERGLDPLAARRPHMELYIRWRRKSGGSGPPPCPGGSPSQPG